MIQLFNQFSLTDPMDLAGQREGDGSMSSSSRHQTARGWNHACCFTNDPIASTPGGATTRRTPAAPRVQKTNAMLIDDGFEVASAHSRHGPTLAMPRRQHLQTLAIGHCH